MLMNIQLGFYTVISQYEEFFLIIFLIDDCFFFLLMNMCLSHVIKYYFSIDNYKFKFSCVYYCSRVLLLISRIIIINTNKCDFVYTNYKLGSKFNNFVTISFLQCQYFFLFKLVSKIQVTNTVMETEKVIGLNYL